MGLPVEKLLLLYISPIQHRASKLQEPASRKKYCGPTDLDNHNAADHFNGVAAVKIAELFKVEGYESWSPARQRYRSRLCGSSRCQWGACNNSGYGCTARRERNQTAARRRFDVRGQVVNVTDHKALDAAIDEAVRT